MARYKFEDIIINATKKVTPSKGDEKSFIAPFHIQSHNLNIPVWGVPDIIGDEVLEVKKGDVLYIKREPKNHQIGISPIDGFCTLYALVFRPNPDILVDGFLPYFMTSDVFFGAAISIAVGTSLKTANWTELKKLEFEIPDKSSQEKLVEICMNFKKVMDTYDLMYAELEKSKDSLYKERILGSPNTKSIILADLMTLVSHADYYSDATKIRYTSYDEIANSANRKKRPSSGFYGYRLKPGQILSSRNQFHFGSYVVVPAEYEDAVVSQQLQLFDVNTSMIIPEYLHFIMSRPDFINALEDMELSTTNWNLVFSKKSIPVPTIREQLEFITSHNNILKSLTHTRKCVDQAYETMQSVLCENIKH